ncbi:MAG TPA: sigma-70 family RNA polymerase sigma factor [Prolixibacteraceae bacterium]|nr:sigma-70 family RNA polymerase sigma factor [Prolixibacteraceae bacterium]
MKLNPNLSETALRDVELTISAKAGDEKAFTQLHNHYRNSIYYMILKMVNNKMDAEELTVEAFEKAFSNINRYEPLFAFSTWLFRIASNCAIDHLRKKRVVTVPIERSIKQVSHDIKDSIFSVKSNSDNPEECYIKSQNAIILRKTVSTLKPRYRSLIEMRYFKEYSYAEIAKELNLPLGTVKIQLFRSHEMLYSLLRNTEMAH